MAHTWKEGLFMCCDKPAVFNGCKHEPPMYRNGGFLMCYEHAAAPTEFVIQPIVKI